MDEVLSDHNMEPIDWQRNKAEFAEEPTDQAGQKRFYKIKRDVIDKLVEDGRLKEEHRFAAQDIRRMWAAMSRGLFPSAKVVDGVRVQGRAAYRDPIARMSDVELAIYHNRYKPWAELARKKPVKNDLTVTWLTLTYDIAVDNWGVRQWEDVRKYQRGTTAAHCLALSLELYLSS